MTVAPIEKLIALTKSSLSNPDAVRIFTGVSFDYYVKNVCRSNNMKVVASKSVSTCMKRLEDEGDLLKIQRGLWINTASPEPVMAAELAGWMRNGAVVSLQMVLGDAGVTYAATDLVTALLPIAEGENPPVLGDLQTLAGHRYNFRGVRAKILQAGPEQDRLDGRFSYLRATPEAALIHWVYLGSSANSHLSMPSADIDIDSFDMDRLNRLASALPESLSKRISETLEKTRTYRKTVEYEENRSVALGY